MRVEAVSCGVFFIYFFYINLTLKMLYALYFNSFHLLIFYIYPVNILSA